MVWLRHFDELDRFGDAKPGSAFAEAAEMLCADEDVDAATYLEWLSDPACSYSTELKGVSTMAKFMTDEGFLEGVEFNDISQLVYDGVVGD